MIGFFNPISLGSRVIYSPNPVLTNQWSAYMLLLDSDASPQVPTGHDHVASIRDGDESPL